MADSFCSQPRVCYGYEHRHCTACGEILTGVGGGGDDGRGVSGYEDAHGNAAHVCTACGDDFFLLCAACAARDSRCADCRTMAAISAVSA